METATSSRATTTPSPIPSPPRARKLIGRLWVHIPGGGFVIDWLHSPPVAAVLMGGAAMLLLLGGGRRRRRGGRRRQRGGQPRASIRERATTSLFPQDLRRISQVLTASAVAALAFLALSLVAFTRPTVKTVAVKQAYTQQVGFGYLAHARAGPVYPGGIVNTGDPIFTQLVHRVVVTVAYHFSAGAPHRLTGTLGIVGALASPTGWSRNIPLAATERFGGDEASAQVTIDLPQLQALIARVSAQTRGATGGAYTLTVAPQVHVTGTVAGRPITTGLSPALSFQLGGMQLLPSAGSTGSGAQPQGLTDSQSGSVATSGTAPNTLGIGGVRLGVGPVRWIALAGFLLAAGVTVLAGRCKLRRIPDPSAQIHARHRHLIVAINGIAPNPARPPIDVTSFDALAHLAQRSERLILHHHQDGADTYLIDDEGTLYQYQTTLADPPGPAEQPPPADQPQAPSAPAPNGAPPRPTDSPPLGGGVITVPMAKSARRPWRSPRRACRTPGAQASAGP